MRKSAALALAGLLALGLLALAGCGDKEPAVDTGRYAGRYVSQKSPPDYIELASNNTFTLVRDGETTSGSFDVEGDDLLLSAGSYSNTMKISGDTISDRDGTRYEKKAGEGEGTGTESGQASQCKKAMIDFYLKDKPEDFTGEIYVSGFEMNDGATEASGVIDGTAGAGAVNHGYAKVGDRIQGEPVGAEYVDGMWVCSWATP